MENIDSVKFILENHYNKDTLISFNDSKKLILYTLEKIASLDSNKIEKYVKFIIDGSGDGGIDAIYMKEKTLYLIQSKFSIKSNLNDVKSFVASVKNLMNKNVEDYFEFLDPIKKKTANELIKKWKKITSDDRKLKCIFVTCAKKNGNSETEKFIADIEPDKNFTIIYYDDILNWDSPFRKVPTIFMKIGESAKDYIFNKQEIKTIQGNSHESKIVFAIIKSDYLIEVFSKFIENKTLFSMNLRNNLNKNKISKEIEETALHDSENFIKFNNGITIICENVGISAQHVIEMNNLSIVNGAQTISTLYNLIKIKKINNKSDVFVKILTANDDTIGNKISKYSNTQNSIKKFDYFVYEPLNEKLYNSLLKRQIHYSFKRGANKPLSKEMLSKTKQIKAEILLRLISSLSVTNESELIFVLTSSKNSFTDLYTATSEQKDSTWEKTKRYLEDESNIENIIKIHNLFLKIIKNIENLKNDPEYGETNFQKFVKGSVQDIEYLIFSIFLKNINLKNERYFDYIEENFIEYIEVIFNKLEKILDDPKQPGTILNIMKRKRSVASLLKDDNVRGLFKEGTIDFENQIT